MFEPGDSEPAGEPVCHYHQVTPGGEFDVCHTEQDENSCAGHGGTLSLGSCNVDNPKGYCSLPRDGEVYYYPGSVSGLKTGCSFANGEWTTL